jgi:hypothetical protein
MNNGEAYAIFKQIESDKYTDSDKLEAINRVLGAETHNGITKDDLINAFKWFHGVMECYLSEKDMSDRQMQEICSEIDKYSGSGLTPERCAELAQAEREGRLVVLPFLPGEEVYYITSGEKPQIKKCRVWQYHFGEKLSVSLSISKNGVVVCPISQVYKTREEAEAALEKQEGAEHERD